MTKGFVTLATGDIKYYKMALNMLKSFRLHNSQSKMAIVCDKENDIVRQFDDVIVLEKANGDYRDKLSLLVNLPYDENIFIEPDCLIYRDLSFFWDLLSKESDFSCFGWNSGGLDVWFKTDEAKKHILDIVPELTDPENTPLFNPGYFFMRKGEKLKNMHDDCMRIADAVLADEMLKSDDQIFCRGKLRDDPIFNIAMAVNGFVCNAKPKEGKCMSLPSKYKIDLIDLKTGKLDVTDKSGKKFKDCALLHFSTRKVYEEGLYLWQSILLKILCKNKDSKIYDLLNNNFFEKLFSVYRYIKTRFVRVLK